MLLALLVALTTGTVLAAVAAAQRGETAVGRLWARTLPATVTVLANQPGFDWSKVEALPEVTATGLFVVYYGAAVEGLPGTSLGFPLGNAAAGQTVEHFVVLSGRMWNPARPDEVLASPHFLSAHHLRVGDTLTVHLSSPAQAAAGFDATTGAQPLGPQVKVTIVGVARSPFSLDAPGDSGQVIPDYAFFQKYRAYIMGNDPNAGSFVNAVIRLRGGEAEIPAFRADLARVTGRSDIDMWDNADTIGRTYGKPADYEAFCLLAFGVAALLASLFLVGQVVIRHAASGASELRVLQAVGLTRWQAALSAAIAPGIAAAAGATLGVAAAYLTSAWTPVGIASLAEPDPGLSADWLVLIAGWVVAVLLVAAGTARLTWTALTASRYRASSRASAVAAAGATAGLPVAAAVGTCFALEPGHGRSAVPVLPAIAGAVAGVLGVLAAFTFSAGVSDAIANPVRFGVTWQLETFYGTDGQDFGPAGAVSRAVAASPDVSGFLDTLIAGAQDGGVSIESYTYSPVGGKRIPVVLTAGRMPAGAAEIALAPTTARLLHAGVGTVLRLSGGTAARTMTVTGIAFVPDGPHNSYDEGGWLTPAGYSRLFSGALYAFKFHAALVSLRPGVTPADAAGTLTAAAAAVKGGAAFPFTPPQPPPVQQLKDMALLPTALGAFLALLAVGAVGAVGYALTTAVSRRRHELAVLRALGLTGRQTRLVVVTQATLLAVIGLAAGIPLGLAVGRSVWQEVANFTPFAYVPPFSPWALALIVPATLLCANLLALWPGWRAARLRPAAILRAE